MEFRIVRAAEVRQLLPMADCIDLMATTMQAVAEGRTVLPLRSVMRMANGVDGMGQMAGYIPEPECFGIKLVSLFPGNTAAGHSSHLGVVLLFEAGHGRPVAMVDAGAITAIRTAAASGLATRLLSRDDAGDLALLGAGEQAASHLEAMAAVRTLRRVRVWARDLAKATAFAISEGARLGLTIEAVAAVPDAVAGADIICTTTGAREPILFGEQIAPGCHVNLVGSIIAAAAEIDTPLVVRSRYFVDYRGSTVHEAGEYRRALAAGAITPAHIIGEIGEVINGSVAGRLAVNDVTIYKSLGIAAQDLAAASLVFQRARDRQVGQTADF